MASFSIYNKAGTGVQNFPDASQEQLITIVMYDEQGINVGGLGPAPANIFGTVYGFMTKELEGDAVGNYSNIFNIQSNSTSLVANILRDETQHNIANYGILTKKVYLNGESPTLDVSFRCWSGDSDHASGYIKNGDKTGINNPVMVANALIGGTLPRIGANAVLNATSLSNLPGAQPVIQGAGAVFLNAAATTLGFAGLSDTAAGQAISKAGNNATTTTQNANLLDASNGIVNGVGKSIFNGLANLKLDDYASRKPPICHVTVGNIFDKDMMFVKTVHYKFSKEYLSQGVPLYGDFDVTLQSLFNAATLTGNDQQKEAIFGSGLNSSSSKSQGRVSFDA